MIATISSVLMLSAGVGFAEPIEGEEAASFEPNATDEAIHRMLSVRHPDPACESVEALSPTPVIHLLRMVEHVQSPPWVPMRAATCLIEGHAEHVKPQLEAWVSDPGLVGLGILTLNRIDAIPEEVALSVAGRALKDGDAALDVRMRLSRSARESVVALVASETP